jgi:hypothetical protein
VLWRSQGGFSTKRHLRAEGGGKPLALLLTAGERHEQSVCEPLLERGAVKGPGRGRPRVRPQRVADDKAYSSGKVRRYPRRRGNGAVIPPKANSPLSARVVGTIFLFSCELRRSRASIQEVPNLRHSATERHHEGCRAAHDAIDCRVATPPC